MMRSIVPGKAPIDVEHLLGMCGEHFYIGTIIST